MKSLKQQDLHQVSAGFHIKFHFNPFQFLGAVVVGAIAGGPFGIAVAVSTALVAQGSGQLYDMGVDQWGNKR